jgi:hypothetical protein
MKSIYLCLLIFLTPISANSENKLETLPKHLEDTTVIFINGILPLGYQCKIAIFLDSSARTDQLLKELKKIVGNNKLIIAGGDVKTAAPYGFHITDSKGTRSIVAVGHDGEFILKRDELIENFSVVSVAVNEVGLRNAKKIGDEQIKERDK